MVNGFRKGRRRKDGVNSSMSSRTETVDIRSGTRQEPRSEVKASCRTLDRDEHQEDHIGEVLHSEDALTKTADLHVNDAVGADVDKDFADTNDNEKPDATEI